MDILGITGVAAIAVICYLCGKALKAWDLFDDRKIPIMMGLIGALLGAIAPLVEPTLVPASGTITAIAVGAVSGLTATAIDQIVKQSQKCE